MSGRFWPLGTYKQDYTDYASRLQSMDEESVQREVTTFQEIADWGDSQTQRFQKKCLEMAKSELHRRDQDELTT